MVDNTRSSSKPSRAAWYFAPHDPLVFGKGPRAGALLTPESHTLPLPSTIAGAVRALHFGHRDDLSFDEVRHLLKDVTVRGPWLWSPSQSLDSLDSLYVPPPAFLRAHNVSDATRESSSGTTPESSPGTTPESSPGTTRVSIVPPTLERLIPDEGSFSPHVRAEMHPSMSQFMLCYEDEPKLERGDPQKTKKDRKKTKMERVEHPITLRMLVKTLLSRNEVGIADSLVEHRKSPMFAVEPRVHVSIDHSTSTAFPGALFSSGGVRYRDDVSLVVEVELRNNPPSHTPPQRRLGVLGGQGRLATVRTAPSVFPSFDQIETEYRKAWGSKEHAGMSRILLLSLITPASFSVDPSDTGPGWYPKWMESGRTVGSVTLGKEALCAVATDRFVPFAGWNLKPATEDGPLRTGQQRPIRRLVPAGTVYFLQLPPGTTETQFIELCREFWGAFIDTSTSSDAELVAAPHDDGYGMVIPGLWSFKEANGEQT